MITLAPERITAQRVLDDVEDAEHVHREDRREDVRGVVGEHRDLAEDAGVGEGDLERAEALERRVDGRGDLLLHGHVRDREGGVLLAELAGGASEGLRIEIDEHHARALRHHRGARSPGRCCRRRR